MQNIFEAIVTGNIHNVVGLLQRDTETPEEEKAYVNKPEKEVTIKHIVLRAGEDLHRYTYTREEVDFDTPLHKAARWGRKDIALIILNT